MVTGRLQAGGAGSTHGPPQLPTLNAAQPLHSPEHTWHKQDRLSHHPDSASSRLREVSRGSGAELPIVQGCKPLEQQSHEPAPGQIYGTSRLCKQQQY